MSFKEGKIEGVIVRDLKKNTDERGWLIELFRQDEINKNNYPVMSYISLTLPGIIRGPHEHLKQTDYFCFVGPSNFKIILWDNRKNSKTYKNKMIIYAGKDSPKSILIPPRVVHGYKNIGNEPGLVVNFPNKLYAGWNKKGKVDEVRYENKKSPFKFE